jgi:DNA ligase-associated metallophosphoesterase
MDVDLAGERMRLLAERAMHWPAARTVFVADVHLGKAESFRAAGVPVPDGPTQVTLARLSQVVDACGADHLVVLGDLFHARQALAPQVLTPVRRWRERHAGLRITLVTGNHDRSAGQPPADLGIEAAEEPAGFGPFQLRHEPARGTARADAVRAAAGGAIDGANPSPPGYALAGHLHPTIRIGGRAAQSARLCCFWLGRDEAVLPAFGEFTGGARLDWRDGDQVYAIAGDRVLRVPSMAPMGR